MAAAAEAVGLDMLVMEELMVALVALALVLQMAPLIRPFQFKLLPFLLPL